METRFNIGSKQAGQSKADPLNIDKIILLRQQQRRMRQQARLADLKIAEIERRVIPVDEMHAILVELAAALSTRLRSQPARLMERLLPHLKPESHDLLYELLTGESHSLLEELKTLEPGAGHPIDPDLDEDELRAIEGDEPEEDPDSAA